MAPSPAVADEHPQPPGELALEIVAGHLSVDASELELVRIEPMQWRDSSIGCPQPGMNYLQVITPGHFAQVRDADGGMHRVHMAGGRGFVCEQPAKPAGPQPLPGFSQAQLEALARADLAQRLDVPAGEISLVNTRPTEWQNASLGCDGYRAPVENGPSKGFIMTLAHAGRRYTYHADLRQAIPCPPIDSQ